MTTHARPPLMTPPRNAVALGILPLLAALALPAQADAPRGDGFTKARVEAARVHYAGAATLSGTIERRTDAQSLEIIGERLCFFPGPDSAQLIPREPGDARMAWFCFSNSAQAMVLLPVPQDRPAGACGHALAATVVVTDYVVDRRESEVFDTARLVRVLSSAPPRRLPCE